MAAPRMNRPGVSRGRLVTRSFPGLSALGLLLLGAACQEPFDVRRKDLGPFRIAAVGTEQGVARAAIWSGVGAYHDDAPLLSWSQDGVALGEGHDVAVPGTGLLQLSVTAPDGSVHQAQVSVAEPPPAPAVAREAVSLGADLSLDARRAASGSPVEGSVASGEAVRLRLSWEEGVDSSAWSTRWMSAMGEGSLLELETFAADVIADEVELEEDEVISREAGEDGITTHLALVIDGAGGNRWTWLDAAIGVDQPLVRHEGRLLALGEEAAPGLVAVRMESSDDLWGLQPVFLEAVSDLDSQDPLPCAPADQPFRLAWLVEGRCTRGEVAGARVVLELW